MKTIVTGIEAHGAMLACVEWWENAGRYDERHTAWGWRLELYRDGAVYRRRTMFHREQGRAFLRRQKFQNLDVALKERASWQDFRDEWVSMQKNLGREVVDVARAKKDK